MTTISAPSAVSLEAMRVAFAKGPSCELPAGWSFRMNWRAFITDEDLRQALRVERSGSLDDWLDPAEDVFEDKR